MNLDKKQRFAKNSVVVSLLTTIGGVLISSWKLSVVSLLVFCVASNVHTVLTIIEKMSVFERINNLLKKGVFDDVITLPDDD